MDNGTTTVAHNNTTVTKTDANQMLRNNHPHWRLTQCDYQLATSGAPESDRDPLSTTTTSPPRGPRPVVAREAIMGDTSACLTGGIAGDGYTVSIPSTKQQDHTQPDKISSNALAFLPVEYSPLAVEAPETSLRLAEMDHNDDLEGGDFNMDVVGVGGALGTGVYVPATGTARTGRDFPRQILIISPTQDLGTIDSSTTPTTGTTTTDFGVFVRRAKKITTRWCGAVLTVLRFAVSTVLATIWTVLGLVALLYWFWALFPVCTTCQRVRSVSVPAAAAGGGGSSTEAGRSTLYVNQLQVSSDPDRDGLRDYDGGDVFLSLLRYDYS